MKVVALSDTHTLHKRISLPEGDLLVHAGDFSNDGEVAETVAFLDWLNDAAQSYRSGAVLIAGNHDKLAARRPELFQSLVSERKRIKYLENSSVTIEGRLIFGSPVTPLFANWAFEKARGKEIDRVWEQIPEDCDLLITHGPPGHILDKTTTGIHAGCEDLLRRLVVQRVNNHVFGHIHEGHGYFSSLGVNFYNVAILNERYELTHQPTVFDI